ncbi:alpha-(1-_3)-arabinofuranosyltransferase family protein [Nocardioides sp.]|uniref:alpha-(1->3)-arabinofuranosyltransferase domain-containing protein n=1 Tax=Nocardioides sp. TaxID=35761 RepID=UPI0035168C5A
MITAPTPLPPIRRSRLVACCVLVVGLLFVQDAGLLVPDTKFDLVAAPLDWLSRALHVWDAEGGFGQVQNQAHGYLWPMGPFFALLDTLGIPGWVVQRLWQSLVLGVALVGLARLARALGVRSDLACLAAGFAYAFSPRMLTSLGPISIEVWPSAVAPWVLLPLVVGAERGSPRRAAALSGLAVAMVGGVNAAASFAVVPLAAVWILTRTPGARRRALLLWWPVFTALGTAWWIVPLLVMGRVSPPFLDYTETSALTTFPTTLFDVLRGTSHWVPYLDPASRAGNDIITTGWLAVNTAVIVVVGLVGLLDRRTPQRTFLVLGLVTGVLLVAAGHHGAVQGWFAGEVSAQLDGVLAPLRNVHKFDPVVRVPLLIGLAFALDRVIARGRVGATDPAAPSDADAPARPARADRAARRDAVVLVAAVVLGIVGTASPVITGRAEAAGATLGVPDYWRQAAADVARRSTGGTTLVVPGSAFAEYLWGDPRDEPMQWLAGSRWAVRSVGILAEPGLIRMLDGLERRFAEGRGSAGLTAALRRAGVEQVVVRNDLRPSDDVPSPALVQQAIAASPGLVRVASFGPVLGGDQVTVATGRRIVFDAGRRTARPAVEIYAVQGSSPAVSVADPSVVAAGSDDLADLTDAGVIGAAPVRLAADVEGDRTARPRRVVLTDGLRARERLFSRIHDGASATLTPGDRSRILGPVRDVLDAEDRDDRWSTTARLVGARAIAATSAASDADAAGGSDRGRLAYAAVDGSVDTAWRSAPGDPTPSWRIDLSAPRSVTSVRLRSPDDASEQRLRVVTDQGAGRAVTISPGGSREVRLPRGADGTVRWIAVEQAEPTGDLRLAEVVIPGARLRRVLDLPRLPSRWGAPDVVSLRADRDGRTGCVRVGAAARCAAGDARTGEDGLRLARSFELPEARTYEASVRAVPRGGAALDELVLQGQPASVAASSTALADPRAGAVAAIDGDPGTAWLASLGDERPTLRVGWLGVRRVSGLTLALDRAVAARRPTRVALDFSDGRTVTRRETDLDADGTVRVPPVRADRVTITVLAAETAGEVVDARDGGEVAPTPVGVSEIGIRGLPVLPLTLPAAPVRFACGTGPQVQVAGRVLRTALVASPRRLAAGSVVPAEPCDADATVTPLAGPVEVTAAASATSVADTIVLRAVDDPGEPSVGSATVRPDGPVVRRLGVGPADGRAGSTVVAVRESANVGWSGRSAGAELAAVTLDGWQQGFVLPPDAERAASATMVFAPDRPYRLGLAGGIVLALVLLAAVAGLRGATSAAPALADRDLPAAPAWAVSTAVAVLVAGTSGLLLAAVVGAAITLARRRSLSDDALPWLLALPVLLAGLVYSLRPWASPDGWAGQIVWVGHLALVPLVALPILRAGHRRSLRRMVGRSTRR